MTNIFLIRHGQSFWNLENKFTGLVNIGLTSKGRQEAEIVGEKLANIKIDLAYTSQLIRAQETALIALESQKKACEFVQKDTSSFETLPIIIDQRLNERCYGNLQGMDKDLAREKFGSKQVHQWRRGFLDKPPEGESLFDTSNRVKAFMMDGFMSELLSRQNIAIFAHGNSIRALHMLFLQQNESQIMDFEVKTGHILKYKYNQGNFKYYE